MRLVDRTSICSKKKRRKKKTVGKLTWSTEATSDVDLRRKEKNVFPVTKTLFDLGNCLNSLGYSLGKIVKL